MRRDLLGELGVELVPGDRITQARVEDERLVSLRQGPRPVVALLPLAFRHFLWPRLWLLLLLLLMLLLLMMMMLLLLVRRHRRHVGRTR